MSPDARVAVLGAGTMGSRIAALFGAAGIRVLLLDLTEQLAAEGHIRAAAGPLVTPASFDGGLANLSECEWVLEAVAEDLAVKRTLWQRAAPHVSPHAIASTNTSGLSLAAISEALPLVLKQRFLGIHFFNPPAKLRLVELIRGRDTLPEVAATAAQFVTERLGKSVVQAKDTPNFIANRIGAFFSATAQQLTASGSYTVEEVDSLTGPLIGLPRSATYRLMDVIGLDIWAQVLRTGEQTDARFHQQTFFTQMLHRRMLGDKSGAGFYRKVTTSGQKSFEVIDLHTFEYKPSSSASLTPSALPEFPAGLRQVLSANGRASSFLRPLLTELFKYCHQVAPEIANSPEDIDRAMQWGYGWALGPFALEAALS